MNCTASSYFIPHSIRAKATKTGALSGRRNPVDQFKETVERIEGGKKENRRLNAMVHMAP